MEAARAAAILRYSAGEAFRPAGEVFEPSVANQTLYTRRRPIGVVGLITPWNFPVAIPVWKLAPALIYGNTVVLKLGYEAPRTGFTSPSASPRRACPQACSTSSPARARRSERSSSPTVTCARSRSPARCRSASGARRGDGAKLPRPARARRAQPVHRDGRRGARPRRRRRVRRRVLVGRPEVHRDAPDPGAGLVYDAFREKLLARIDAARWAIQPILRPRSGRSWRRAVRGRPRGDRAGKAEGGTVAAGGDRGDDEAYLIAPTVFENVADDAFLSCEEVFGPVTSLYRFSTLDEALERANAVEFGLSAAIFTRDLHATQRFANELQAGILHVNSQTAGADVHVPFGGSRALPGDRTSRAARRWSSTPRR